MRSMTPTDRPSGLTHAPLHPPRRTFAGESVFARRWAQLMGTLLIDYLGNEHEPLDVILADHHRYADPRTATVAASFVTWLGTNCGMDYMLRANRLKEILHCKTDAYVAALGPELRRRVGVSYGWTLAEHLLTPRVQIKHERRVPAHVTIEDLEVMLHVAAWLGETDGAAFLSDCQDNVRVINARWVALRSSQADEALLGDIIAADAEERCGAITMEVSS